VKYDKKHIEVVLKILQLIKNPDKGRSNTLRPSNQAISIVIQGKETYDNKFLNCHTRIIYEYCDCVAWNKMANSSN